MPKKPAKKKAAKRKKPAGKKKPNLRKKPTRSKRSKALSSARIHQGVDAGVLSEVITKEIPENDPDSEYGGES